MERKRDEAIRAKRVAERKLGDKDFGGAKKYAVKAQSLCPDLDGISQMSTIVDVYISAEKKVNGEVDWYGILGVKACDDEETIRKQYRKLALMLHPDKNKLVGADGAFKLVSEAWSLLSDKGKRLSYNQRRSFEQKVVTFWTVCHGCRMQFEYLKIYLNQTLLCPNCKEPFLAKESAAPVNFKKSQHQDDSINSFCNTDPSIASKAANLIQRVNERLKRERQELSAGFPSKNRKVDVSDIKQPSFHTPPYQMPMGNNNNISGIRTNGFETDRIRNSTRELTAVESRNMLMKKAQKEIRKWLSDATNKSMNMQDEAMSVPDPDFHNFDSDRTENSFQDYQVWSAYDDDDGMPRFYALIHKVLSRKPLQMKISWLNSKTTAEFGKMEWIASGFRKTCGEFRVGKFQINTSLNSFSQKVKFTRTPRGSVVIYPKKGDVWALYRNWSCDWNESVPDHVIHQYDMVEVVAEEEEGGVDVRPLVKLTGFRTVFCPHSDKSQVKKIPKEEMFRFSHQVPKYLLTGKEAFNSPKGYLELDPAATPLDLIQTTT